MTSPISFEEFLTPSYIHGFSQTHIAGAFLLDQHPEGSPQPEPQEDDNPAEPKGPGAPARPFFEPPQRDSAETPITSIT